MVILPFVPHISYIVKRKMTLIVVLAHLCVAVVWGLGRLTPNFKDDGVAPFGQSSVGRSVSTTDRPQHTRHFSLSQGNEPPQEQTDQGFQATPTIYLSHDEESRATVEGKGREEKLLADNLTETVDSFWDTIESFFENGFDRQDNRAVIHIDSSTSQDSSERNHTAEVPLMEVSLKECLHENTTLFISSLGVVKGLMGDPLENISLVEKKLLRCTMKITTPSGLYVAVAIRFIKNASACSAIFNTLRCRPSENAFYRDKPGALLLHQPNQLKLYIEHDKSLQEMLTSFEILVMTTNQPLTQNILRVVFTSLSSGYVTTPGYGMILTPTYMNVSHTLYLPEKHSMMLSFSRFSLTGKIKLNEHYVLDATDHVTLSVIDRQGIETILWKKTGEQNIPTETYNTSVRLRFTNAEADCIGFKLYYTFHPWSAVPRKLHNGLFDCSVPHYASFKHHVHCNLQQECQGREDEGSHCAFSSPACNGSLAVADKCFVYSFSPTPLTWEDAQQHCRERGGQLASIRGSDDVQVFQKLFRTIKARTGCYIGLVLNSTVPNLYRNVWFGLDGTVSYIAAGGGNNPDSVLYSMDDYSRFFYSFYETDKSSFSASSFVCEYTVPAGVSETSQSQRFFPLAGKQQKEKGHILTSKSPVPLTVCPGGYMTRDFLACDLQAACHSPTYVSRCSLSLTSAPDEQKEKKGIANTVALFVCENFGQSIPYTLVCDFTVDCFDGSDENSCHHVTRDCSSYRCENGQCKERRTRCNRVDDCADGSDERYCNSYESYAVFSAYSALIRIDFTSHGTFQLTALHASNKCPETHFRCDENFEYCLPVYVLCNNIRDCPNGEDELHCENYTCPGFYRCRDSSVCVHVEQVCDGVAQCPRQDDELLCDATCPEECVCQGLAFVCPRPFPAHSYPPLRYLDASHSAMTFSDLANNTYLMWLSLAFCEMHTIHRQYLPNLRSLDLSHNEIETLSFDFVMVLPNLKEVVLSGNPLLSLVAQQSPVTHSALRTVDLSAVYLSFFNCNVLNNFPEIQSLNLSHNRVGLTIDKNGFTCVQYLKELDLRGTDIQHSSVSIFGTLTHIETIYSDNYRHCCSQVLPETVNKIFCIAPLSGFSSCTDLLRLDLHRVSMWIMAVLSSVGNMGFAAGHFLLKAESNVHGSTMQTFMANLGAANFVMGLYLFVVVVADVHFRGDFLSHEVSWVRSVACKAAGFLAMASTEASAFFVFLLALDRFMSLCFCCVGFHKRSAWTACVVSWLCAIGLASVMPWLIGATASHRYTRMNICTAMPTLNEKVGGHKYSFGILVVLNTLLALGTAFCQTFVYLEVRPSYIFATANERSRDMVLARRVATVLVTDVICTLIVGVTGLMSSIGVTGVGDEVIVAVVIFVIPLKPSLNPLLHSFSMLTERKRMSQESRLLRLHETQCRARTTVRSAPKEAHRKPAQTPFGNKHDVFVYLKQSLESRCVLFQDIEELLTQYDDGNLRSHTKD